MGRWALRLPYYLESYFKPKRPWCCNYTALGVEKEVNSKGRHYDLARGLLRTEVGSNYNWGLSLLGQTKFQTPKNNVTSVHGGLF